MPGNDDSAREGSAEASGVSAEPLPAGTLAAAEAKPSAGSSPSGLKLVLELAPLLVWVIIYKFYDLVTATAVLIPATLIALGAAKVLLGKVSPMQIAAAVLVVIFGGLTVALKDPDFIKIKVTVIYLLFAGVLAFGMLTGRNLLKVLLGEAMHLDETGWRLWTRRWVALFLTLAIANEIIRRAAPEQVWLAFKFPGLIIIMIVFGAAQIPFLRKHEISADQA